MSSLFYNEAIRIAEAADSVKRLNTVLIDYQGINVKMKWKNNFKNFLTSTCAAQEKGL